MSVEEAVALAAREWESWCKERAAFVTSRTGWLSLVSYQKVTSHTIKIDEIPASMQLAQSGGGILLTADADSEVLVDGALVDGTVFVERLRSDGTPVISCGRYSFEVFSLDGKDYELRVYDAAAENLVRFDRILAYEFDPTMVLHGRLIRRTQAEGVPWEFTRSEDTGHAKQVPATIELDYGQAYELMPFRDGEQLVLSFADMTTGIESYMPGRFLRLALPDHDDECVLDFNRAFIPPCGFSDFYSCPIPPQQNRFNAPIRAGEVKVLWRGSEHDTNESL